MGCQLRFVFLPHSVFLSRFPAYSVHFPPWVVYCRDWRVRSPTPCSKWPESDVYPDLIILKKWDQKQAAVATVLRPQSDLNALQKDASSAAVRCLRKRFKEWSGESVSTVIYKSWCSRGKQRFHPKYLWGLSPCCTSTNIRPPRLLLWNFSQGNKIWLLPLGLAVWSKHLFHFRFHTVHRKSTHGRPSLSPTDAPPSQGG